MVKVEHQLDEKNDVLKIAFQASGMEDFAMLELLRIALSGRPDVKVGFLDSKRLVAHFKGCGEDSSRAS